MLYEQEISLVRLSDGDSGQSSFVHIKYSNDGKTFTPNNGEDIGSWLGIYTDDKEEESTVFSDYKWSKILGATGAVGTGIDSVTKEFYLSDSKTTQSGSSWQTKMPEWSYGKYLWTREKIVYKNPTSTVYTTPSCDSSWEAANVVDKKVTTLQTDFKVEQGKIESLIKETTIDNGDGTTTSLKDAYNQTKSTVEGNKTTIAKIKTSVDDVTGKVTDMESAITEIKQTADGVQTTVTENKAKWNKASSDASSAVSTANKASGNASTALSKATTLETKANNGEFNGRGVKSTTVEYQASTSGTTAPSGTWSPTVPTVANGSYLWTRTTITYTSGDPSVGYSVARMGVNGAKGDKGETGTKGDKGDNGSQGFGLVANVPRDNNFNEHTWSTSIGIIGHVDTWSNTSSIRNGCRVGDIFAVVGTATDTKNGHIAYYRSDTSSGDLHGSCISHTVIPRGATGAKGETGSDGKGISSIVHHYLVTNVTTGVTSSTSGWKDTPQSVTSTNKYLWYYQTVNYTAGSPTNTTPAIIGVYGDTGNKGATGKGISSVTPQYYLSSSNTTQAGGSWKTTQDTWSNGKYYWTRDSIAWSDGTTTTTTPTLATGLNNANSTANSAQTIANQTASKFQWIVKSGSSATDFTLTDRTAQLIADSINLKGLVTFKGLDSSTQNQINTANSNASSAKAYTDAMQNYGYQYTKELYINGDTDKYYPVIIYGGNQDKMRNIVVSRSYSSQAPAEWNGHSTAHGIALNLKIKCNFGDWGGAEYKHFITDFSEQYGHVFAGCAWVASFMGYAIFLRGGGEKGAYYRIYSDQPLTTKLNFNPQKEGCEPYYNGSKDLLGNSGETYKWYAPEPRKYSDDIAKEIANMYTDEVATNAKNVAISASSKIDNLQIGGRNLLRNTAFNTFDYWTIMSANASIVDGWCEFTIQGRWSGMYQIFTPKKDVEYMLSYEAYLVDTTATSNRLESDFGSPDNFLNLTKTPTKYTKKVPYPASPDGIINFQLESSEVGKKWRIRNIKLEEGNKATDWTPAPEDKADQSIIDNWAKDSVVNGETVINGGYIKTHTIKTDQLAVEDIFATGSAAMNVINAQEINANRITSGQLSAERINAYGLSIINKNTNQQTFNITNTGEVSIKGSVSSSNYNIGKTGWSINNDGTAEFNDIIARGSVITNDGGIVSSGESGRNLLRNTAFNTFDYWSIQSAKLAIVDGWCEITINDYWSGITQNFTVQKGVEYIVSYEAYLVDTEVTSANLECDFGSPDNSLAITKTPTKYIKKIPYPTGLANYINFQLACGEKGKKWRIRNIKLEEGDVATDWSPAPEDKLKQVRFWAGTSFEDRESAPFIVYSDGSIKATQGEYSGLWTGDIQVGNISISDKKANAGNDALLTIQNGENGIKKVQLTDGLSSSFAQDVIVTNNTYSTMISLKQDGSAYLSKGLNVADKATLNSTSLIINNNTLTTTSSGGGFLFNNDLHIGSSNKSANLLIHGNTSTGNITIDNTLYFGNVLKFTKNANGINIDFI